MQLAPTCSSEVRAGGPVAVIATGAAVVGLGAAALLGAREADAFAEGRTWISQGGTPHGTLRAKWLGMRNVLGWGARNLVNPARTGWVLTTYRAESEARKWENELFHAGDRHFGKKLRIGYDNGPDAFRHTYASASIVYRLIREKGADADQAVKFLHGAGNAHERDSWLHTFNAAHGRSSSEMDVANNLVGHALGARMAAEHAAAGLDVATGEALLRREVLEAIGRGDTKVLDRIDSAPRASRWADVAELDPAAPGAPRRTSDGAPVLRTHVPDAPGFPMPIRDGRVDLSLPFARLGPAELRIPRDDVPQA